jgi:hypothetical protein
VTCYSLFVFFCKQHANNNIIQVIEVLFNLFSKRNKESSKNIFTYDKFPQEFKVQVIHVWVDAIGPFSVDFYGHNSKSNEVWNFIHKQLCKECGLFELSSRGFNPFEKCQHFIQESTTERTLDIIELSFKYIDVIIRSWGYGELKDANIETWTRREAS